jgi:fatty-acyl-CoA synthase
MEVGELLIRMPKQKRLFIGAFEGYLNREHERRAILANVFAPGDRYYRTGDCVYYDRNDFFYFVDRMGDVFRSRGHNVSTSWIAEQIRSCAGVEECLVTAVALDDTAARVGLAAVVPAPSFRLKEIELVVASLPKHSQPPLLTLSGSLQASNSFKLQRSGFRRSIYNPFETDDTLYLWGGGQYRPVNRSDWSSECARLLANTQIAEGEFNAKGLRRR